MVCSRKKDKGETLVGEMAIKRRQESRRKMEKEVGQKENKRRRKGGSRGWSFLRWCKKGTSITWERRTKGKRGKQKGKKDLRDTTGAKGGIGERLGNRCFCISSLRETFGVANAASENIQDR